MACPILTPPVFEHHHDGLGVDCSRPRISWKFEQHAETEVAWLQTAYEIEITFTATQEEPRLFKVSSNESVLVPWPARPLLSRESAAVRVRVFGKSLTKANETHRSATTIEHPSAWSEVRNVEAALLEHGDFKASFITTAQCTTDPGPLRPLRFRREFSLPTHISKGSRARLYITAMGVYEAWLNGKRVGGEELAPGWTSYKHRLAYRIFDVTDMIDSSRSNILAIEAAEGWYAGRLGFNGGKRFRYGDKIGVFAQLEVGDWSLVTDDKWTCASSPIVSAELYDGEVYDARDEDHDWNQLGDCSASVTYNPTIILPWPETTRLVAPDMPPVRVTERRPCQSVFQSASGKTILDFGQNLVGKLQVKLPQLSSGAVLTFRHAEVMEHGELGTRPLRHARAQDTVIGTGKPLGTWTPKFTFHGFRYVQVDEWPGDAVPTADDFEALVLHTDMKRRGFFECSNKSVNQLHQNVVWSMRGNFVSLPTDCPQRDERLGWTGDLQVFAPTASFLYDTTSLLSSWLQDLAAEQLEEGKGGIPPLVVPNALSENWPHMAQAIWDDVAILTPNVLYQYSADTDLLERQFRSMQAWLEQGVDRAPDGLWNPVKWQLADWLDPSAPPQDPGNGRTDSILVANAYLIQTTRVFARICSILHKPDLAKKYDSDAARLLKLFQRRYITPEGSLMACSQTGLALAIQFDLYPRDTSDNNDNHKHDDGDDSSLVKRQTAAQALDRLVRTARFHISTGFAGTPVIAHALTKLGKPQLAYRMLLETTCPSWLYPITMGATTIWERWDSMLPDGAINPGEMTSFNHYALGAVADWLHASVGGIAPLDAGWRRIRVRPVPGGNVTSAHVRFDGPYGMVSCEWLLKGGNEFWMKIVVPPNCSALVTLPCDLQAEFLDSVVADNIDGGGGEKTQLVHSGIHEFSCAFLADEWPPMPLVAAYQPLPPLTIAE